MSKITIPLLTDSIGKLLDPSNCDNTKDSAGRDKIVCKNAIKQKLKEIIILNKTINDTSLESLPDYNDLKQIKQQRAILIEEIWELYCEAKGIEYNKPKDKKKVTDMTAEELEAVLKAVNANRPQQTMNFYAPIGQQIAHVDKIEAHFDKDMTMHVADADEVNNMDSTDSMNNSIAADDTSCDVIIPADCKAAIERVLVPTYTINNMVMNSMQQLTKAAKLIDLTSNSEVAMLMAVGQEINAVRPGVSCPDFVRALIGMGVITYTDNKAIGKMADGMTKKLNGYKKGEKKYPPLPANHQRWNTNDQPIGNRIYEAMKS